MRGPKREVISRTYNLILRATLRNGFSDAQCGFKAVRRDVALKNLYTRVRKRSGAKIARVAAARKLAEICWKRLRRWQREHARHAA